MLRLQQKEQERVSSQEQESFSQLEFKLAETRAKLARTQQVHLSPLLSSLLPPCPNFTHCFPLYSIYPSPIPGQAFEDLLLSKEDVDRELELERLKLATSSESGMPSAPPTKLPSHTSTSGWSSGRTPGRSLQLCRRSICSVRRAIASRESQSDLSPFYPLYF